MPWGDLRTVELAFAGCLEVLACPCNFRRLAAVESVLGHALAQSRPTQANLMEVPTT